MGKGMKPEKGRDLGKWIDGYDAIDWGKKDKVVSCFNVAVDAVVSEEVVVEVAEEDVDELIDGRVSDES